MTVVAAIASKPIAAASPRISGSTIFGWTAVAGAGLAALSFVVARRQASPGHLHPRAAGYAQPATTQG